MSKLENHFILGHYLQLSTLKINPDTTLLGGLNMFGSLVDDPGDLRAA